MTRVEAGMLTSRFCTRFDVPERTWRRRQARARAERRGKGPWPQRIRFSARDAFLAAAPAHSAWGHSKVWALAHHDGAEVLQATVPALLRDEDLILPAEYQKERRRLAERLRAVFATKSTGPNEVWQLDSSEYVTTADGVWGIAFCRDCLSKYEYGAHVSPTANVHDAVTAVELALAEATLMRGAPLEPTLYPETGELEPVLTIVTDNGGPFRSFTFEVFIAAHAELCHVFTRVRTPGQNGSRERRFGPMK